MKSMDKRIILSLPAALYSDMKKAAARHYQSVSAYVRESILDKVLEETVDSRQYDKLIRASRKREIGDKIFDSPRDAIHYLKNRSKKNR